MTIQPVQTSPLLRSANDHPIIYVVFPFLDFKSLAIASRTCHSMQGRVQRIPTARLPREQVLFVNAITPEGALPPVPRITDVTIKTGGILDSELMTMVLAKYPNVNSLDLVECLHSSDVYRCLGRQWVKFILSPTHQDGPLYHQFRSLLQTLDWSRLEVLEIIESGFRVSIGDSVWFIPKLRSSPLRRVHLIVTRLLVPEFLRNLPDSIESFSVFILNSADCDALAEKLRNPKVLDLALEIGFLNGIIEIQDRVVRDVLPRFSTLRSIRFRVPLGDPINPYISELCRALQANQVLELIDIESPALSILQVVPLFTALQSKPHLKTVRLVGGNIAWDTAFASMPEVCRLYLQFPESVSITLFRKITAGRTQFTRADAQRYVKDTTNTSS
jgi:hypothetical protein